jgi:hypothetical protein
MSKTVHVIFKTHLDVGFTDFAREVVRRYFEQYIPAAIRVARELRATGGPERFVWTTGSWLIYEYLEQAGPAARAEMEAAIAAGDIRWHALPFTLHSELCDAPLFRFGLRLSRELDRRFGLRTIAAKMTDVPGHTRGIVPLLAEAGVEFLHLGVNPASRAPDVPDVFRWRDAASHAEVTVMYHKSNYGSAMALEGLDHAIAFAHTGDNCGPQSPQQIREQYAHLQAQFPGDRLTASTLDAFAIALRTVRDRLPVVEQELGDTWIHGGSTDPRKTAQFRSLCRLRARWLREGRVADDTPELHRFSRKLLLVPEHTWGLDFKTHLADYRAWGRQEFEAARAADEVRESYPADMPFLEKFRCRFRPPRYSTMEASWAEQRAYLREAVEALQSPALRAEAETALQECEPGQSPAVRHASANGWACESRHVRARIDPRTGALARLCHKASGRELADEEHLLGLFRYETFSAADYRRFLAEYNVNLEHAWCYEWALADFGRAGLADETSAHTLNPPRVLAAESSPGRCRVWLELPAEQRERYGAPGRLVLDYAFPDDVPAIDIALRWFDKPATRLPEAAWLSFRPRVADPSRWRMDKLGSAISPLEVVSHGNRGLHGVGRGVEYAGPDGALRLVTLDAALAAPGAPRLLRHENTLPELDGGWHVLLHSNVWSSNFPLWYRDDALFRFRIELGAPS